MRPFGSEKEEENPAFPGPGKIFHGGLLSPVVKGQYKDMVKEASMAALEAGIGAGRRA
jgi:hypothetical protein